MVRCMPGYMHHHHHDDAIMALTFHRGSPACWLEPHTAPVSSDAESPSGERNTYMYIMCVYVGGGGGGTL